MGVWVVYVPFKTMAAYQHFGAEDFAQWERFFRAMFFNSVGGFKSANLIGTQDEQGRHNLATFFSVVHVGANPPYLGLLFRPQTVERHTLENLRATRTFTVNSIQTEMLPAAHQCSAKYDRATSEFEATGLTPVFLDPSAAPAVGESAVQILCEPVEEQKLRTNDTLFVVGAIRAVRLRSDLLQEDGLVALDKAATLCINSLENYYLPWHEAHLGYAQPENKAR
ncbi:MAG: flavin reductase [Schleiferiaceae bacterium]|nr:flavin reductase [Schleiferiaceae bacterium]